MPYTNAKLDCKHLQRLIVKEEIDLSVEGMMKFMFCISPHLVILNSELGNYCVKTY